MTGKLAKKQGNATAMKNVLLRDKKYNKHSTVHP